MGGSGAAGGRKGEARSWKMERLGGGEGAGEGGEEIDVCRQLQGQQIQLRVWRSDDLGRLTIEALNEVLVLLGHQLLKGFASAIDAARTPRMVAGSPCSLKKVAEARIVAKSGRNGEAEPRRGEWGSDESCHRQRDASDQLHTSSA